MCAPRGLGSGALTSGGTLGWDTDPTCHTPLAGAVQRQQVPEAPAWGVRESSSEDQPSWELARPRRGPRGEGRPGGGSGCGKNWVLETVPVTLLG